MLAIKSLGMTMRNITFTFDPDIDNRQDFGDDEMIRMTFTFTFYIFGDQLNRSMVVTGEAGGPRY